MDIEVIEKYWFYLDVQIVRCRNTFSAEKVLLVEALSNENNI
jgi:hypothetical protein